MNQFYCEETLRLLPLWEEQTTYGESGMFIGEEDKFPLLFQPHKILSVTSSDLTQIYREGVDFKVTEDGYIQRLPGSHIPFISKEEYYADDPEWILVTKRDGKDVHTYWGEGDTMYQWQICVNYTHGTPKDASIPADHSSRYERVLTKLQNGENITVLFLGDSITAGANSTYQSNRAPYMYPWTLLSVHELARRYGYRVHHVDTKLEKVAKVPAEDAVYGNRGTITYINTAVGGWRITNGMSRYEERVSQWIQDYGCDLFVLAFGMNDKTVTAEEEVRDFRTILDQVIAESPNTALLTVATMLPNPLANERWNALQYTFEPAMLPMAEDYWSRGIPCSVVPMTTMSRWILERKRFCDVSGNNINHPNDFLVRLYAQTLLRTLTGYAFR
ncbi:MAG: SGNH/GDSL hydrolase family protein [Clostridia bacterium]|nr:SGNH/GDSL hydrolase family protein [Clostridia bacterium]